MRSLLAPLFMLTVLHVACGRTSIDAPRFRDADASAGTGGGGGTGSPLPGVSAGGNWGGTPAGGGAAGSTSSAEPDTGGQGPVPAGSPAGASALAGKSATGGSAAGNPASRSSSVGGQPGLGGTSMGGRLSVAGTTSIIGGSGGAASGGSSSSGGSCTEVTACGGDVVGTWEVTSQCLTFDGQADVSYLGLTCIPNVASINGSLKVTGKLTLGSDGMFKDATTTAGTEVWRLDKSCLILSGTTVNCASIGRTFEGALKTYGYESMTCKDASSGGGCTCANTINTDTVNGRPGGMGILHNDAVTRGVYKTNGNKFTLAESISSYSRISYTYCVKGNEMTVSPIPVEDSATPYRGTIVLTRSVVPTGGTGGASANGPGIGGRTAP